MPVITTATMMMVSALFTLMATACNHDGMIIMSWALVSRHLMIRVMRMMVRLVTLLMLTTTVMMVADQPRNQLLVLYSHK